MPAPSRISHATFETPDVERAVDYFTRINGLVLVERTPRKAFLATATGLLAIQIEPGEQARCAALAFETDADTDPAVLAKSFAAEGVAAEQRTDAAPGIDQTIVLHDPNGTRIELFRSISYVGKSDVARGVSPLKLGHVAFFTPDPRKMADFYTRVLGFRISDWIEDFFVFMRCNPDHHTVNFLKGEQPRMHHIAFELKDIGHIAVSCDLLARERIPIVWGPLRFGPGHNLATFHRNHDQQLVEFYAELDQMKDERAGYYDPRPWHRDKPQRPKVWSRTEDPIWGPPPPAGFM